MSGDVAARQVAAIRAMQGACLSRGDTEPAEQEESA